MSVTTKRSTRITFVGCCNLPQEKALRLRDSLQTVVLHLMDLHAACDDDKIKVDEKHKLLKDLTSLSTTLADLVLLGEDQVRLCESIPDIQRELNEIYLRIKSNNEQVVQLFHSIGTSVKGTEQSVAKAVDSLVALVRDIVELLRVADQYTIKRVEIMCTELVQQSSSVSRARDLTQLLELASPLATQSVALAKVVYQRATAVEDGGAKAALETAAENIAKHVPVLIASVRASIGSSASPEVENSQRVIQGAAQQIIKILSVAPEFAVLFDVTYIDTELAAKLASLSSAVKEGDAINVSKHSKAVGAEVAKQVKAASADKSPATQEKVAHAQKATTQVLENAKEALAARNAGGISAPAYLAKEAALHNSAVTLQDAVAALPAAGPTNTTTHLIKAAQDLSKKLQLLLTAGK